MRETLVISAFPACGKTYAAKYLSESERENLLDLVYGTKCGFQEGEDDGKFN